MPTEPPRPSAASHDTQQFGGCFVEKKRKIHLLPVNDHGVRRSLISVATTFLLTAPTRERKKSKMEELLWRLIAKQPAESLLCEALGLNICPEEWLREFWLGFLERRRTKRSGCPNPGWFQPELGSWLPLVCFEVHSQSEQQYSHT